MKYVAEITDLMAAFPGRDFKMAEIVRYVAGGRKLDRRGTEAVRRSTRNALHTMQETGVILVRPPTALRGGFALYRWRA